MKHLLITFVLTAIGAAPVNDGPGRAAPIDYRQTMRDFVQLISKKARQNAPSFIVVPQNALDLGFAGSRLIAPYINAVDGIGCEELFYGLPGTGKQTPPETTNYFLKYLAPLQKAGKKILVIDYVTNRVQAQHAFNKNRHYGFISFQGEKSLTLVPSWNYDHHPGAVSRLNHTRNFLYILNPRFNTKAAFLLALKKTNYDLLIIDAFFHGKPLSPQDVSRLKVKKSGKNRLVIAYLSIGEAETYRYYWKKSWQKERPVFLDRENPQWKNNYKVKYWMEDWQKIICGTGTGEGFNESYLKKILDAGFDGVYLDIIDAAMYFEDRKLL